MKQRRNDNINIDEALERIVSKIKKQFEIDNNRFLRFEKWLESNSFDDLMQRIKEEHSEEYIDKCYKKSVFPYPNNKLDFIIKYIKTNYEPIVDEKLIEEMDINYFYHEIYFFKGYHFLFIYGQGVILKILKNKKIFLEI